MLVQSPFNLTYGLPVYAVVYVSNYYGTTQSLSYGSGAYITINATTTVAGTYTTTYIAETIVVSWTAQTTTTAVSNYTVMIGCANGTWATTPYCNGASATVIAN